MTACSAPSRLSRPAVLAAIRQHYATGQFTTTDLAGILNAREYAVRAVVAWLVCGGIVQAGDAITRRDRAGRPYKAICYSWTGEKEIRTVAQDRDVRRRNRERDQVSVGRDLAMSWLSRAW